MANATPSLWGDVSGTTAQAAPAGFSAGQTGSLWGDDTKYKPLFNYDDASQVDYDTVGDLTEREGMVRGVPWSRDAVREVQLVGGEVISAEKLRAMDGGSQLLRISTLNRRKRRDFMEALTEGPVTDFIPYVGDLASTGVAIKNMKVARDAIKKMREGGPDALTTQEKVLLTVTLEDMKRMQNATFGGMVGGIVRKAPAFAVEFASTGWLLSKAVNLLGKGGAASVTKFTERLVKTELQRQVLAGTARAATSLSDDALKGIAKYVAQTIPLAAGLTDDAAILTARKAVETKAFSAAKAYASGFSNAKFRNIAAEWAVSYAKRGFVDHLGDVYRGMPPGFRNKMAEAAGILFLEAPIKGMMYGNFDWFVVNPIVARAMGADEAVTQAELMYSMSDNPEVYNNAKMLAWGSAMVEYISEHSGRAFDMFGASVIEQGQRIGRAHATKGLKSVYETSKDTGSFLKKMMDRDWGSLDEMLIARAKLQKDAVGAAIKGGKAGYVGKTIEAIMDDPKLVNSAVMDRLRFQQKQVAGYWLADKMLDKGITGHKITKYLQNMGYDGILQEFMEERIGGFMEGLYGLDAEPSEGFAGRMAAAVRGAFPESWTHAAAEIVAFALPTFVRSMTFRAHSYLDAGMLGKVRSVTQATADLQAAGRLGTVIEAPGGTEVIKTKHVSPGSRALTAKERAEGRFGSEATIQDPNQLTPSSELAQGWADIGRQIHILTESKVDVKTHIARFALNMIDFVATGHPHSFFNNPTAAMIKEGLGADGAMLAHSSQAIYRSLYEGAVKDKAVQEAFKAKEGIEVKDAVPENAKAFIDARINEAHVKLMDQVLQRYLAITGAAVVSEQGVSDYLDEWHKKNGTYPGNMEKQALMDAFMPELKEAAANRMSVAEYGGRVVFSVKKQEHGTHMEVSAAVESFLETLGVQSYADYNTFASPTMAYSPDLGLAIDGRELDLALSNDGSVESQVALMDLIMRVRVNPDMGTPAKIATEERLVREDFTLIRELLNILHPGHSRRTKEARAAGEPLPTPNLVFLPSMNILTDYAALLTHPDSPVSGYLKSEEVGPNTKNPARRDNLSFEQVREAIREDVRLSELYMEHGNKVEAYEGATTEAKEAAMKLAHEAYERTLGEAGYETLLIQQLAKNRIHKVQHPTDPTRMTFMITPGAVNKGDTVYMPTKSYAGVTVFLEEGVETVLKRTKLSGFLLPAKKGTEKREYGPAARAFIQTVARQIAVAQEALAGVDTVESRDALGKLDVLAQMYDVNASNKMKVEAIAHAAAGIILYRGDAEVHSTEERETIYYKELGNPLIARAVRSDPSVHAFRSLLYKAFGGKGVLPAGPTDAQHSVLAQLARAAIPGALQMDKTAARNPPIGADASANYEQSTPLQDLESSGAELERMLQAARTGEISVEGLVDLNGNPRSLTEEERNRVILKVKLAEDRINSYDATVDSVYTTEDLYEIARAEVLAIAGISAAEAIQTPPVVPTHSADGGGNVQEEAQQGEAQQGEAQQQQQEEAPVDEAQKAKLNDDGEPLNPSAINNSDKFTGEDPDQGDSPIPPSSDGTPSASLLGPVMKERPVYAMVHALRMIELRSPGERDADVIRAAWEWWSDKDVTLKEYEYEGFKKAVEESGIMKLTTKAQRDALRDAETGRSEERNEDLVEGTTDEDTVGAPEEDNVLSYSEGKANDAVERDVSAQLFTTLAAILMPETQHSMIEVLQNIYLRSYELSGGQEGSESSLASLFDRAYWDHPEHSKDGKHWALENDATWESWLKSSTAESSDPILSELKEYLQSMGRKEVTKLARKLKEAYRVSIQGITATVGPRGQVIKAELSPKVHNNSADVAPHMVMAYKSATQDHAEVHRQLQIMEELTEGRDPDGETAIQALSDGFAALFGPNNMFTRSLASPGARAVIQRSVQTKPAFEAQMVRKRGNRVTSTKAAPYGNVGYLAESLHGALKLSEAGESAERVVAMLLRGDVMIRSSKSARGFDRGAAHSVMNELARAVHVSSAQREEGEGKVKALRAAPSAAVLKLVQSPQFTSVIAKTDGNLAYSQRFIAWADGTELFTAYSGVKYQYAQAEGQEAGMPASVLRERGEPSKEELTALNRKEFEVGQSEYVHGIIYTADKQALGVAWPRAFLHDLTGKDVSSYNDFIASLAAVMGTANVEAKRLSINATASGASIVENKARVGVVVPIGIRDAQNKIPKSAKELFHGLQFQVGRIVELAKQYDGKRTGKYHATATGLANNLRFAFKGLQVYFDHRTVGLEARDQDLKRIAESLLPPPAAKAADASAEGAAQVTQEDETTREMSPMESLADAIDNGYSEEAEDWTPDTEADADAPVAEGSAILTDMDSMKISPLKDAVQVTREDGTTEEMSLVDAIAEGFFEQVKEQAEALIPGIEVNADAIDGTEVLVVSWPMGLRQQWAASSAGSAKPGLHATAVNAHLDHLAASREYGTLQALAAYPWGSINIGEILESEGGVIQDLVQDSGLSVADPNVAEFLAPKISSRILSSVVPHHYGVSMWTDQNVGARVRLNDQGEVEWDPEAGYQHPIIDRYGKAKDTIFDAIVFGTDRAELFGGEKIRLASMPVNIDHPLMRYGLYLNLDHVKGLNYKDHSAVVQYAREQILRLKNSEHDDKAFIEQYAVVAAMFEYANGEKLGKRLVSFTDLCHVNNEGKNEFYMPALFWGADAKANKIGEVRVYLGGTILYDGRTPSEGPRRSDGFFHASEPASYREAGPRDTFQAIVRGQLVTLNYLPGTLITGREAILKKTPLKKHIDGSDEDGDGRHGRMVATDKYGRELQVPEGMTKKLMEESYRGLDPEKYNKDDIVKAYQNKEFREMHKTYRTQDVTRLMYLPDTARDYSLIFTMNTMPVKPTPFTAKFWESQLEKYPAPEYSFDHPSAARHADDADEAGIARGITTSLASVFMTMAEHGISVKTKINHGEPLLKKPAGAQAEFWDQPWPFTAGGKTTSWNGPKDIQRLNLFASTMSGIKNATFDNLNAKGLSTLAGFTPEFLDIYTFLLFESNLGADAKDPVEAQAQYEAFHEAFAEWSHGPEGRAITAHKNWIRYNESMPEHYQYAQDLNAWNRYVRQMAREERIAKELGEKPPWKWRAVDSLFAFPNSFSNRSFIDAIAMPLFKSAAQNAGDNRINGDAIYSRISGFIQAFSALKEAKDIRTVLAYKKENMAFFKQYETFVKTLRNVASTVAGEGALQLSEEAKKIVGHALKAASARVTAVEEADAHTYVLQNSVFYGALSTNTEYSDGTRPVSMGMVPLPPGVSSAEWAEFVSNTLIPFRGVLTLMPAAERRTITRLIAAIDQDPNDQTRTFVQVVEAAMNEFIGQHMRALTRKDRKTEPNLALTSLLTPSPVNKATRIVQVATGESVYAPGAMQKALEQLRDWTIDGNDLGLTQYKIPGTVTEKAPYGRAISPNTFYYMLQAYAALTAPKALESKRAQSSLLPLFGAELLRNVSNYQILALHNPNTFKGSVAKGYTGVALQAKDASGLQVRDARKPVFIADAFHRDHLEDLAQEISEPGDFTAEALESRVKQLIQDRKSKMVPGVSEQEAIQAQSDSVAQMRTPAEKPVVRGKVTAEIVAPPQTGSTQEGALKFIQSYKNIEGIPNSGPGTVNGTGADADMRSAVLAADFKAFVGVIRPGREESSSTGTSLRAIASANQEASLSLGNNTYASIPTSLSEYSKANPIKGKTAVAMVAGNSKTHLTQNARIQLQHLADIGFSFVVGSMANHTDSEAIDFLRSIGAPVTIHSWTNIEDSSRLSPAIREALIGPGPVTTTGRETPQSVSRALSEDLLTEATKGKKTLGFLLKKLAQPEGRAGYTRLITAESREKSVVAADALRSIAQDTTWMPDGARPYLAAAAEFIAELGYADPAIVQGAFLAAGAYARQHQEHDAVAEIAAMLSGKVSTTSQMNVRQTDLVAKREALTTKASPLALVLMHAVAVTPALNTEVLRGLSTVNIVRRINDGMNNTPSASLQVATDSRVNIVEMMDPKSKQEANFMVDRAVGASASLQAPSERERRSTAADELLSLVREAQAAIARNPSGTRRSSGYRRAYQESAVQTRAKAYVAHTGAQLATSYDEAGREIRAAILRLDAYAEVGSDLIETAKELLGRYLVDGELLLRKSVPSKMTLHGILKGLGTGEEAFHNSVWEAVDELTEAKLAKGETEEDRERKIAQLHEMHDTFDAVFSTGWALTTALNDNEVYGALTQAIVDQARERAAQPGEASPYDALRSKFPLPSEESMRHEAALYDFETGLVDPIDDFKIRMVDSKTFFEGATLPILQRVDIRKILMDKLTQTALPEAIQASNFFANYFGLTSEAGALAVMRDTEGREFIGKDGKYMPGEIVKQARFDRRTVGREAIGVSFTEAEFALAYDFSKAAYIYSLGDKAAGKLTVSSEARFFELPWDDIQDGKVPNNYFTAEYGDALLAEAKRTGESSRIKSVQKELRNIRNNTHADVFKIMEADIGRIIRDVARNYRGNPTESEREVLTALSEAGYVSNRTKVAADGKVTYYGSQYAVPVQLVESVFRSSSAFKKLTETESIGKRDPAMLTLRRAAEFIKPAFQTIESTAAALRWPTHGDARMFNTSGGSTPFMKGSGYHSFYAKRATRAEAPKLDAALSQNYLSLVETLKYMWKSSGRTATSGRWRTIREGLERGGSTIHFAIDLIGKDKLDTIQDPAAFVDAVEDGYFASGVLGITLLPDANMWDLAREIYKLSSLTLFRSAFAGATIEEIRAGDIALKDMTGAIEEVANDMGLDEGAAPGMTASEIYNETGALPDNIGIHEALSRHAQEMAVSTRYRQAVNQLLLTANEDGNPLIYMRPGHEHDETIPDAVWSGAAKWWARVHGGPGGLGVHYDNSKSGRENAKRLFDVIDAAPKSTAYSFSEVTLPQGIVSVSRVLAMTDRPGDDTSGVFNVWNGGAAKGIATQVFDIVGYSKLSGAMAGLNRALSWSKSASVMGSLFFPIATAIESPVGAVGMFSTFLGMSDPGVKLARMLGQGDGWFARKMKQAGIDVDSPFMKEIYKMIGTNDPGLVDLKVNALLSGMTFADRAKNMMDSDRTIIDKDIEAVVASVKATQGRRAAKATRIFLEGALQHSSEFAFEYVINATKLAVFAQMSNRLRQKALDAGRWWDPVRDMQKWSHYINSEIGGIDPAMFPWATRQVQRRMKSMMFSWEWTMGAWTAGGGDALTASLFGMTANAQTRKHTLARWMRMYLGVMVGIPQALQLLVTGMALAAGQGDDDDKWFTCMNEYGHAWSDFDITPLLRMIAAAPALPAAGVVAGAAGFATMGLVGALASGALAMGGTALAGFGRKTVGDVKRALPETAASNIPIIGGLGSLIPVGNLIPALTGQEGDRPTTRKRRYYMHFGKQGWEFINWFKDAPRALFGKTSMPVQRMYEGLFGRNVATGWEMPFADKGFWERWLSLDGEKSALINLGNAFVPFSAMGIQRNPEAGLLVAAGPISKGMSKTRAKKEMAAIFSQWADADTYVGNFYGRPGAFTDLKSMVIPWLEALRLNGYDPQLELKQAIAVARAPLYEKVHNALPRWSGGNVNYEGLEKAARGLFRLNYIGRNLNRSLKARDKNQNIRRDSDLMDIRNRSIWSSFFDPYGPAPKADPRLRQQAAKGGDVAALLATDEIPDDMLGYKIVPPNAEDMDFFEMNPDSPGFFREAAAEGSVEALSDPQEPQQSAAEESVEVSGDPRELQQAAKGGDVALLLATDKMPDEMLGYKIVPPTEEDLAFFEENPDSPGLFREDAPEKDA